MSACKVSHSAGTFDGKLGEEEGEEGEEGEQVTLEGEEGEEGEEGQKDKEVETKEEEEMIRPCPASGDLAAHVGDAQEPQVGELVLQHHARHHPGAYTRSLSSST